MNYPISPIKLRKRTQEARLKMEAQLTDAQRVKTIERKALKIGIVGTIVSMFLIHPIVAPLSLVVITVFSNMFLLAKARLLFYGNPQRGDEDDAEMRHKNYLINMPITSSLSVYHNAGAGYQHYHHHSQFHR